MSYKDTAFKKTILSILENVAVTRFEGLDCSINISAYSNVNHHFKLKSQWTLNTTTSMQTYYGQNSSGNYSDRSAIETAVDHYSGSIQSLNNDFYKNKLLTEVAGQSSCNHLDHKEIWLGAETGDFTFGYSCNSCSGNGVVTCRTCKGNGYTNCSSCDFSGKTLYGNRNTGCTVCNSQWTSHPGKRLCINCSGHTCVQCKNCKGRGGFTEHYEVSIKAQKISTVFSLNPSGKKPEQETFIQTYALSEHRNNHIIIENSVPHISYNSNSISFVTNGSTLEHKATIELNGGTHETYYLGERCSPVEYGNLYDELVTPLLDHIESQNTNAKTAKKQLFKTDAAETIHNKKGNSVEIGILALMNVLSRNTISRILKVYTDYEQNLGKELNIPIDSYVSTTLKFVLLICLLITCFDSVTFGEVPYGQLGVMPIYTFYTMYEFKIVAIASITTAACICIPAIFIFGRRNKITLTRIFKSFVFSSFLIYVVLANVYYIFEFMGEHVNIESLNLGFVVKEALVSIPGLLAISPEILCIALLLSFLRARKKASKRIAQALSEIRSDSLKEKFKV